MQVNKDFRFDVSISNERYEVKPTDYRCINYNLQNLSLSELTNRIKQGYCFMSVLKDYKITQYTDKQGEIKQYQKSKNEDVKQTNIIGFDIDDSDLEFSDYINTISIKPSFAYTTFNHNVKGKRYRLLYLLSKPISNQTEFESLYYGIMEILNHETKTINKDNCGHKIERLFNGNSKKDILEYISFYVYDLEDLPKGEKQESVKKARRTKAKVKEESEYFKMFQELSFTDFLIKYKPYFNIIQNSNIDYNKDGFALLDESYIEIKRIWENGKIHKKGIDEDRKKYLYNVLQLKKLIKPSISMDELLFNAAHEMYYYINNSDKKISKDYIIDLVNSVFNSESKIKAFQNKKKFKVDKDFCDHNNITANQYKNKVKQMINYNKIDEWYNTELTPYQNYKFAVENNIKVSRSTLNRYSKERGYTEENRNKKTEIKEWYDSNISVNDNYQIAMDNDIKISLRALYDYCKKNNINTKGEITKPKEEKEYNESISSSDIDNYNSVTITRQTERNIIVNICNVDFLYNENIPNRLKEYIERNNKQCCKECLLKIFHKAA